MAMNPMQRKANNYLLIGVLVTLLITGTIIGFLVYQLVNINKEREAEQKAMKKVYVVATEITSGDTVSIENLKEQKVPTSAIPSNVISIADITEKTIAKINLGVGTVLTSDMVQESDNILTNDIRLQEYNMLVLTSQIETGDYIDIRFRMPSGEDYIVISKKKVEIPTVSGIDSATSIWLNMSEADTLIMSNAIVEAYTMPGSKLYVTQYVEPGMQIAATSTYVPKASIQSMINTNPNIEQVAKNALFSIYNANVGTRTNTINGILNGYLEDERDNIEENVEEELSKAAEERQSYLESLGAY